MKNTVTYISEIGFDFFPSRDYELQLPDNPEKNVHILARNTLRLLMMGWQGDGSITPYNEAFQNRDHTLLRALRFAFQQGFEYLYTTQLIKSTLSEQQLAQAQLYISNCLCLLLYVDLNPQEALKIPQYINGQWQLIEYKIVPIELTPITGFKQLVTFEEDRIFAYGFEPMDSDTAEPLLIFLGTNAPSGQGFISQINADLEPFATAGKKLYLEGLTGITAYLDKQQKKTHVIGTSLGGSLSLILALHQGEKLSRVDAHNPAGIFRPWFQQDDYDRWESLLSKPDVFIQRQGNDQVTRLGCWKQEWNVLQITPVKDKQGPSFMFDHGLNYAGLAGTVFEPVSVEKDNQTNRLPSILVYGLARSLLYFTLMVPFRYLARPLIKSLLKHKTETLHAGFALALLWAFPQFTDELLSVYTQVAGVLLLATYAKMNEAALVIMTLRKAGTPLIHGCSLLRNESMNNYTKTTEATFSIKDLSDYYQAKRVIVKNKPPLPIDDKNCHVRFFGSVSKRQVIEQSLDAARAQEPITIEVSTAKLHDIKTTLKLIHRFGFEQGEVLKKYLVQQEHDYMMGKDTTVRASSQAS